MKRHYPVSNVISPVLVSLIPVEPTVAVMGSYRSNRPNAVAASASSRPSASVQWGTHLPGK